MTIEPSIKTNVTNLIETWKKVTLDDYRDKFPYAPKKIMRSPDNRFNFYGGAPNDDVIQLAEGTVIRGGSNDIKTRLMGTAYLRAEWRNAKKSKTGIHFATGYDAEMDSNRGAAEYLVMTKVWTQTQADAFLEDISERLNSDGTYKK